MQTRRNSKTVKKPVASRKPVAKKKPVRAKREPVTVKDVLRMAREVLPHLCIIMCGMFIVFFLIDCVNSHTGFMTNKFHRYLIFALSICCAAESMILIGFNRRIFRAEEKKRQKALAEKKKLAGR